MKLRALILIFFCIWQFTAKAEEISAAQLEPGYISITPQDKLFYLLARAKNPNAPLVVYLAGGPGASSVGMAFLEFGPLKLTNPFQHNTNYQLVKNKWSWSNYANVVYLDQPRYTGYSYGTGAYRESLTQTSQDFITWLNLFYTKYPEFKQRPLYLAGESFGGEYIAQYIHDLLLYNHAHPKNMISLTGVFVQAGLIGEGQHGSNVSPYFQLDYLCEQNMLPASVCQLQQPTDLRGTLDQCVNAIAAKKHIAPATVKIDDVYAMQSASPSCGAYLHEVSLQPSKFIPVKIPDSTAFSASLRGKTMQKPLDKLEFAQGSQVRRYLNYSPNPFNIALTCQPSGDYPPWCYDDYKTTHFFNDPYIKAELGRNLIPASVKWQFANFLVALVLDLKPAVTPLDYYAEALRNNIKIIFVYGKNDYAVNYFAGQATANQIVAKAYQQALFSQIPAPVASMQKLILEHNGTLCKVGEYQTLKDFTFVQVNNAGHMVGMEQPRVVNTLFNWLLK